MISDTVNCFNLGTHKPRSLDLGHSYYGNIQLLMLLLEFLQKRQELRIQVFDCAHKLPSYPGGLLWTECGSYVHFVVVYTRGLRLGQTLSEGYKIATVIKSQIIHQTSIFK